MADFGYDIVLVREASNDTKKAEEYLPNIMGFRLVASLGLFALIIIVINIMGYPQDVKEIVYVFGAFTLIAALSTAYKVTFRAFEVMKYEAITIIVGGVIRLFLGVYVLAAGYSLLVLAYVFLASGIVELSLSLAFCNWRFVRPRVHFNVKFIRETIWVALSISIFTMMMFVLVRADTILLSMMKGQETVGWYNAAYNLVLAPSVLPSLFLSALFPSALKASNGSKELFWAYYQKSVKYLIAVAIPLSIGFTVLAAPLILTISWPRVRQFGTCAPDTGLGQLSGVRLYGLG